MMAPVLLLQAQRAGPSRAESIRALAVLERLATSAGNLDAGLARQLTDALLPILATASGSAKRAARADEAAALRVLGTLAAVWSQLAPAAGLPCTPLLSCSTPWCLLRWLSPFWLHSVPKRRWVYVHTTHT